MKKINTEIWACFLNDAMSLVVDIMSPIWNGNSSSAYSLSVDGAGILEICKIWSNDYITGAKNYTNNDFCEKINRLKNDSRYVNNLKVQRFCDEYMYLINGDNSDYMPYQPAVEKN